MVAFLPPSHAIHRINRAAQEALERAQLNVVEQAFATAHDFASRILADVKISVVLPDELRGNPASLLADLSFADLCSFWATVLTAAGLPQEMRTGHAEALARRSQLVRAFDDPDRVLEWATEKAVSISADFPRTARDIEVGRNPGDVLDPYILAANQSLLYGGDFRQAIGATVAHKALMILEGLLGHLHEEVIGRMRGNMKTIEPRGENQELFDAELNPFPGADIVQPPTGPDQPLRLHQVKSKTGTLNSSGGARLAEQMRSLRMRYRGAEIYSHSLVGNTLRGHRSMGTMLRAEPELIVTVGAAAFRVLTGSAHGAELLLRLYQTAFALAAERTGYGIEAMAAAITEEFRTRAEAAGEGFFELLLEDVTTGAEAVQDSRLYVGGRRRRAQEV